MAKYPLALLPVVTISGGQARLAPPGYGASTESGTPAHAISSWVGQGAAWIHVVDQDALDGLAANHHHIVSSGAHLQYSGAVRRRCVPGRRPGHRGQPRGDRCG